MAKKKTTRTGSGTKKTSQASSQGASSKKSTSKKTAGTGGAKGGGAKGGGAKQTAGGGSGGRRSSGKGYPVPDTEGKQLVIVESPTKAKTINKYLGPSYAVMASVGHVRDLPKKAATKKDAAKKDGAKGTTKTDKSSKQSKEDKELAKQSRQLAVPGVDIDQGFQPTYEVLPDKKDTVRELRKAAEKADGVWFATDLDREGEAIAWHLAEVLGVPADQAKRVVFNAITRSEIQNAFEHPRPIDLRKVNAQQARRILDRLVGYQVSPLLWKKVYQGLSAGRVQSVAVRLVVERERQIDEFVPDEFWKVHGVLATDAKADQEAVARMARDWAKAQKPRPDGQTPTQKELVAWLNEHRCLRAELTHFGGEPFKATAEEQALEAANAMGFALIEAKRSTDPKAKGPAQNKVELVGQLSDPPPYAIHDIQTKRTTSKPYAPFITSTLQQAAANRLGYPLKRTMQVAQQLYEGVDIHGQEGQVGLITYMRTDSTHLSADAVSGVRGYIEQQFGSRYLPEKPNVYTSSNKSAQEAHEAIRPTDVTITPQRVRNDLTDEQYKLYKLIWERFVGCQMTPAQWDATTVLIQTRPQDPAKVAQLKATGRRLAFDGFYRVYGVPASEEVILPPLSTGQPVHPLAVEPTQHFTSPPARYTEASLQKKLEEEGIGRPSTYAAIIQTIQDRKYVEPVSPKDKRMRATDLGCVVTDLLVAAFPSIMKVDYTRQMEQELDQIEEENLDWVRMLEGFYGPFKEKLLQAFEEMRHAKAHTEPAPYTCPQCGAGTVYRFGRNGRFLSCETYRRDADESTQCKYAAPIDREGRPVEPERSDVLCPKCQGRMYKRKGRFGPFLGCENYPDCDGIVKLDAKSGTVQLPKVPPLTTELTCPKCEKAPLYLRSGKRGPWLSCSSFPKCRGRSSFTALDEQVQKDLTQALELHEKENPQPTIRTVDGRVVPEGYAPQIEGEEEGQPNAMTADDESTDGTGGSATPRGGRRRQSYSGSATEGG